MKKLYALLVILIVIYVGVNVSVNGFNVIDFDAITGNNNTTEIDNSSFPKLENFSQTKVNDTDIKYLDNNTGVNIEVQEINNSQNLSETYNSLINQGIYTSSQVIDQNGVTAYFLYNERALTYDADIYFNKNNQNYKISGFNTTYENSDYFINHCKFIIDNL